MYQIQKSQLQLYLSSRITVMQTPKNVKKEQFLFLKF